MATLAPRTAKVRATPKLMPERMVTANAYVGALPIARALDAGADIVITGRCVDSALKLGVLVHELGWAADDYDRLAAGSHLVQGPVHRYELPGIHAMNLEGAHRGRGVLYHPGGW